MRGRGPTNVHSQRNQYTRMTMVYPRRWRFTDDRNVVFICRVSSVSRSVARVLSHSVFAAAAAETVDLFVASKAKLGFVCTHIHVVCTLFVESGVFRILKKSDTSNGKNRSSISRVTFREYFHQSFAQKLFFHFPLAKDIWIESALLLLSAILTRRNFRYDVFHHATVRERQWLDLIFVFRPKPNLVAPDTTLLVICYHRRRCN